MERVIYTPTVIPWGFQAMERQGVMHAYQGGGRHFQVKTGVEYSTTYKGNVLFPPRELFHGHFNF